MPPNPFNRLYKTSFEAIKTVMAEDIVFEPLSGGSFAKKGIFNEIFFVTDPDTERVISTAQPNVGIKDADFEDMMPVKNDVFIVRNVKYRVVDTQEDGEASTHIVLTKIGAA